MYTEITKREAKDLHITAYEYRAFKRKKMFPKNTGILGDVVVLFHHKKNKEEAK